MTNSEYGSGFDPTEGAIPQFEIIHKYSSDTEPLTDLIITTADDGEVAYITLTGHLQHWKLL